MATNVYFSPKVKTEQNLYEDIVIESLKMYGQDVIYIPRQLINRDEIMNEDYSKFTDAYTIEMYIETSEGFAGEGDLLGKFGVEIRDQATFVVARKRWENLVGFYNNSINDQRPSEGDLVYLPLAKSLFEIRFVEHEQPFYQLNNLPTYKLECENLKLVFVKLMRSKKDSHIKKYLQFTVDLVISNLAKQLDKILVRMMPMELIFL